MLKRYAYASFVFTDNKGCAIRSKGQERLFNKRIKLLMRGTNSISLVLIIYMILMFTVLTLINQTAALLVTLQLNEIN